MKNGYEVDLKLLKIRNLMNIQFIKVIILQV